MGGCETHSAADHTPREPSEPLFPSDRSRHAGYSSPPMIGRRLPASSSFVLAAARLRALQLDPGRTTAQKPAAARKPAISTTRQAAGGHQARPPRALDKTGPHGWGYAWQVLGSNQRRRMPAILQISADMPLAWANVLAARFSRIFSTKCPRCRICRSPTDSKICRSPLAAPELAVRRLIQR